MWSNRGGKSASIAWGNTIASLTILHYVHYPDDRKRLSLSPRWKCVCYTGVLFKNIPISVHLCTMENLYVAYLLFQSIKYIKKISLKPDDD